MKDKKNFLLIIYILLSSLIIISSFGNKIVDYLVLSMAYLFVNVSGDISNFSLIIEYILLFLIYSSLGIFSFYLFLSCFNKLKYVIIYSVIVNIALIVFSMIIKSFYDLDFIKYMIKIAFNMFGIVVAFIIEFLKVRLKK